MKKTIALSLFVITATACNTGNVQVASPAGTSQPGTSGTSQGSSSGNGGSGNQQPGTTTGKTANKIFFERITVRNAIPQSMIAISFDSENSKGGDTPFGLTLSGNQDFSENSTFTPTKTKIIYFRNTDVDTDALLSATIDSLASNQIFSFPREAVDYSLNQDQSKVAWLDKTGALTVSSIGDLTYQAVDTSAVGSNTVLNHVLWNSDSSYLLARADNGKALLFKGTAKPTLLSDVNAAAFSDDGTKLAYFVSAKKEVHFIDLASGPNALKDTLEGTLESSEIHDLTWNSSTSISYWTVLASQAKELRVFSGGNETTLAALTLPASTQDGVVCPAWIGDKVYFANYDSGEYVIQQINLDKDAKKSVGASTFAKIPSGDLSEGLVCPKVVK
jgi:hypothetical protein